MVFLLIEYQGEQHYFELPHYSNESLEDRRARDEKKFEYCQKNNIKLLKIPFGDFDKISWNYLRTKI